MNAAPKKLWTVLNWPNRISLLRLLLVAPFLLLMLNQAEWPFARYGALAIFAVMAVSDYIDGQMARRLHLKTRLGAILDPLADKVLIICSVVLLSLSGSAVPGFQIPNWVVVAVVGKDLWVILGFLVIYLVTNRFRVQPTVFGKLSTFGQLLMVLTVLAGPDLDRLGHSLGWWTVRVLEYVVAGLSVLAVLSYTRLGLHFVSQGQQPLDDGKHEPPPPGANK